MKYEAISMESRNYSGPIAPSGVELVIASCPETTHLPSTLDVLFCLLRLPLCWFQRRGDQDVFLYVQCSGQSVDNHGQLDLTHVTWSEKSTSYTQVTVWIVKRHCRKEYWQTFCQEDDQLCQGLRQSREKSWSHVRSHARAYPRLCLLLKSGLNHGILSFFRLKRKGRTTTVKTTCSISKYKSRKVMTYTHFQAHTHMSSCSHIGVYSWLS